MKSMKIFKEDKKMAINFDKNEAFAAYPRFYELHVMLVETPKRFHNDLEDVNYDVESGEIVLKGTMEETWVIPEKKLVKYELRDGTPLTMDLLRSMGCDTWIPIQTRPVAANTAPTMCIRVPVEITGEVTIERGDSLKVNRIGVDHGAGDVLCGVDTPWPWVVNGKVFDNTYTTR